MHRLRYQSLARLQTLMLLRGNERCSVSLSWTRVPLNPPNQSSFRHSSHIEAFSTRRVAYEFGRGVHNSGIKTANYCSIVSFPYDAGWTYKRCWDKIESPRSALIWTADSGAGRVDPLVAKPTKSFHMTTAIVKWIKYTELSNGRLPLPDDAWDAGNSKAKFINRRQSRGILMLRKWYILKSVHNESSVI